jgi:hypothetical protein
MLACYPWTFGLKTLNWILIHWHFIYLSCMCASGNHILYFIYELSCTLTYDIVNVMNHASLFIFCSLYSWWFMCFGWWGYYLEICYIMVIWKLFASSHPYKQGKFYSLVKIFVHSLLMINSSICTYLGGDLSCIEFW